MASKRSWQAYPANFRRREVTTLAHWIRAGESGSLIGLPGTGKSNLLSFMCHRPDAVQQHLAPNSRKLALIHVDLNNLPNTDLATFYRVILRALYEARAQLAAIEQPLAVTIETLYRRVEEKTDPFLTQSALREGLLLFRAEEVRLVLMFDPFDQFCRSASAQLLDNLRGLRDSFKTTLSYLVGVRYELAYLRDRHEMGELYEILDTHLCWLGPLQESDAYRIIHYIEAATGHPFSETERRRLFELTGGYPSLLRSASLWLARLELLPEPGAWIEALLAEPGLQNRLQEIWQALTGEEQALLLELQNRSGQDAPQKFREFWQNQAPLLSRLQKKQLCRPQGPEDGRPIFSPLFEAYIGQVEFSNRGKIWYRAGDDAILSGSVSLEPDLTPQDRKLLLFFLDHPYKILDKDELIFALWSEEEIADRDKGIDDMRLQKAVSQLRGVLETGAGTARYIQTVRGVGYRFFPEGAPRGS